MIFLEFCSLFFVLLKIKGLKINLRNHSWSQISFCKIFINKWNHVTVLPKRFHLNGHTIGFHPQTQKLELHYMSPKRTLGVKGWISPVSDCGVKSWCLFAKNQKTTSHEAHVSDGKRRNKTDHSSSASSKLRKKRSACSLHRTEFKIRYKRLSQNINSMKTGTKKLFITF